MKHQNIIPLTLATALLSLAVVTGSAAEVKPDTRPLRILCFGAHPDDCEIQAGGVAALYAAQGHKVKFVSVSNGDIGHWRDAGGPLARRRKAEVEKAALALGIATEVLDIHDGEIMPTLENRRTFVRLIRQWEADIVMGPRPNDYHPDHRYTAILMQDAAFMVTVPFFCPDVPHLKKNPVFLYYQDEFQKPAPFTPDVAVAIDTVIEKKLSVMEMLESQFYERGVEGAPELLAKDNEDPAKRRREVRAMFDGWFQSAAKGSRSCLKLWYGEDRGAKVRYAEAFEICEYGRRPGKDELKRLFPFFD